MYLSANFPLTMELERTGSVGVTHAPIASECRKDRFGTMAQTSRLLDIHMAHIPGPSSNERLFHSRVTYFLGN